MSGSYSTGAHVGDVSLGPLSSIPIDNCIVIKFYTRPAVEYKNCKTRMKTWFTGSPVALKISTHIFACNVRDGHARNKRDKRANYNRVNAINSLATNAISAISDMRT